MLPSAQPVSSAQSASASRQMPQPSGAPGAAQVVPSSQVSVTPQQGVSSSQPKSGQPSADPSIAQQPAATVQSHWTHRPVTQSSRSRQSWIDSVEHAADAEASVPAPSPPSPSSSPPPQANSSTRA